MFGKKNQKDSCTAANSEQIQKTATQITFLINLAEEREDLINKLFETQIRIKYFSPTADKTAIILDTKIEYRIGDIKIALSKAKISQNYNYSEELIDGLILLVAERKSITV